VGCGGGHLPRLTSVKCCFVDHFVAAACLQPPPADEERARQLSTALQQASRERDELGAKLEAERQVGGGERVLCPISLA
jgi:hypothetical protein